MGSKNSRRRDDQESSRVSPAPHRLILPPRDYIYGVMMARSRELTHQSRRKESSVSAPTPVEPFKQMSMKELEEQARHIPVIAEIVAAVDDTDWEALTQAVLRRVARGDAPNTSQETQDFARRLLEEREAVRPSQVPGLDEDEDKWDGVMPW